MMLVLVLICCHHGGLSLSLWPMSALLPSVLLQWLISILFLICPSSLLFLQVRYWSFWRSVRAISIISIFGWCSHVFLFVLLLCCYYHYGCSTFPLQCVSSPRTLGHVRHTSSAGTLMRLRASVQSLCMAAVAAITTSSAASTSVRRLAVNYSRRRQLVGLHTFF